MVEINYKKLNRQNIRKSYDHHPEFFQGVASYTYSEDIPVQALTGQIIMPTRDSAKLPQREIDKALEFINKRLAEVGVKAPN